MAVEKMLVADRAFLPLAFMTDFVLLFITWMLPSIYQVCGYASLLLLGSLLNVPWFRAGSGMI